MKKVLILILSLFIIIGCSPKIDIENNSNEEFYSGITLDNGRIIHFSINIEYNGELLNDALLSNKLSYDAFLKELEYLGTARDGGSTIYKYNKTKNTFGINNFYVYDCNSLDGINDIFITKYKHNINEFCIKKINDLDDVTIKIKDNTISKTGLTIIISDNSDRQNIYGNDYKLEIKRNKKWEPLELKNELYFTSIGYTIPKGKSKEFEINWEHAYGKLKPGNYRIIKTTSTSSEGIIHNLAVEFVIK